MKAAVEHVEQQYAFSQRRACSLLMVAVSSVRYQARSSDEDLRARLVELAREKPRFGWLPVTFNDLCDIRKDCAKAGHPGCAAFAVLRDSRH